MNDKQFELAAELARLSALSWNHTAARYVLVCGLTHTAAAYKCDIARPTVTKAVKRIKQTIAQAQQLAASINQQEEP